MQRLHIDLICRSTTADTDAIRDHTLLLAGALDARTGTSARAHDLKHLSDTRDLSAVLRNRQDPEPDTRQFILLQYNPYSFARRGLPWWLPQAVRRLRRAAERIQVVLLVHELWVTINSVRNTVLGPAQLTVFGLLCAASDLVAVSTESLVPLANRLGRRQVGVLPVGSNLPDARRERSRMRLRLEIREDQRVVAAFGMHHPGRLFTHLNCAVRALAERDPELVVLNLGALAPPLEGGTSLGRVLTPGHLTVAELARYVSIADLMLLPYSDGVATRRTTLMAGLQHGVPVLSTDGASTSPQLRRSRAIALVPSAASPRVYAHRACELLADDSERTRLGQAGRALYESRFAWPEIAAQLVEMIEQTPDCSRRLACRQLSRQRPTRS